MPLPYSVSAASAKLPRRLRGCVARGAVAFIAVRCYGWTGMG